MISNSGTSTLGLYDLKRQIDAFGGVDYFRPSLDGGYLLNARVMLANGDIVKSTVAGNTNDPNVDMSGWVYDSNTLFVLDTNQLKTKATVSGVTYFTELGAQYKWDENITDSEDNYTIIKSNLTNTGRWVLLNKHTVNLSAFALEDSNITPIINNINLSRREFNINSDYNFNNTLNIGQDNALINGKTWNILKYAGDGGTDVNLKSLLSVKKTGDQATSRFTLKTLIVDMNQSSYAVGVDAYFLTSQSLLEQVEVRNIADNSIGFRLSKIWYAKIRQCFASGYNANDSLRHGTGVLIDSLLDDYAQVNAIDLDFRLHTLNVGMLINPVSYIYGLNMLNMPTIENCNIGIKVNTTTDTQDYHVRQSVISAYFENNTVDIEWGDSTNTRNRNSKHTWIGCSFDGVYSTVKLWEGHHTFIGCKGMVSLVVGNGAQCELINTPRPKNIMGSNITFRDTPLSQVLSSTYAAANIKPLGTYRQKANLSSGSTTLNIPLSNFLGNSIAHEGQLAEIKVLSRRSYDTSVLVLEAVLLRKSDSTTTITILGAAPTFLTVAVVNNVLTITETRGDTRYIDFIAEVG